MTLILVRHAQSEANAAGVFTGSMDVSLTDLGRRQAAALAGRLAGLTVTAVYASTLRRAQDTARPTAERFGLQVQAVEALRESGLGEAEGLAWADVRARWTLGEGARWADAIPGAEPGDGVRARVSSGLDELLARHRDDVALCVSHAGAITHALQHVLGLTLEQGVRVPLHHAALNVIEWTDRGPVLLSLNDSCHLEAIEP
ncbi:MAG: histidine phosphatase family protein [Chloroflexi bacterium]|nr:MAG: histidine phosphatase family protein [Chloroflexota bacterium]